MNIKWRVSRSAKSPKTVGSFLVVSLPALGVKGLEAKVDTGAFSGSLHATKARVVIAEDGTKRLKFLPHGKKKSVAVDNFHRRSVKSSNGHVAVRYAFDTEVEILGECYPITITLSNRSTMKYPMLIGRKFLQTHGFLVDVSMINK